MSGLEPGAKAPVQDDPPSSRASSEHSHLNFEEVIGLSVADHFEPGSQDSACWNKFNEVRWKVCVPLKLLRALHQSLHLPSSKVCAKGPDPVHCGTVNAHL